MSTVNEVVTSRISAWAERHGNILSEREAKEIAEEITAALPARAQYSVSYEGGVVRHVVGPEEWCREKASGHEDSHVYRRVVLETKWQEIPQ